MSKPKSSTGVACDDGSYVVTVKTIADIGTQEVPSFEKDSDETKEARQLIVVVEIPEATVNEEQVFSTKAKPFTLTAWLTNSVNEKAKLFELMKACGIKDPASTDLDDLLNKSCIGTVGKTKSGRPKLKSFAPLTKGQKPGKTFLDASSVYLDESYDAKAFEAMPEFIQNKIIASPEFGVIEAKRKAKSGKGKK